MYSISWAHSISCRICIQIFMLVKSISCKKALNKRMNANIPIKYNIMFFSQVFKFSVMFCCSKIDHTMDNDPKLLKSLILVSLCHLLGDVYYINPHYVRAGQYTAFILLQTLWFANQFKFNKLSECQTINQIKWGIYYLVCNTYHFIYCYCTNCDNLSFGSSSQSSLTVVKYCAML